MYIVLHKIWQALLIYYILYLEHKDLQSIVNVRTIGYELTLETLQQEFL